MEIRYQLFENDKLFIQKFSGISSIEKYIKYAKYISSYIAPKVVNKVLIDFRDLKFSEDKEEIPDDYNEKIKRFSDVRRNISQNELKDRKAKIVIWVDTPIPTIIAHLFIDNISDSNYHYCSTSENIINILKLPDHYEDLEKIMENLENKF